MKKFEVRSLLALLLAAIMVFAFVACKGGVDDTTAPGTVETDPTETDPTETDPVETDPTQTDPPETKPVETDPPATEPAETDPPATDPVDTEPKETEPEETECAHEYGTGKVQIPTCQAEGYTTYTCTKCGDTKTDNVTAKVGHLYMLSISSPIGCTFDGQQIEQCTYCGDIASTTVIPASGHSPKTETVRSPSPTHCDIELTTCSSCGAILEAKAVNEHNLVRTQIVPDGKSTAGMPVYGFEVWTCTCGYKLTVSSNSKGNDGGHFFEYSEASGKYECRCGENVVDLQTVYNGNTNAGPVIFAQK